ncbi:unnamed protein product [Rotaria sordida]|uniref:Uncharacterized protein n=1 Tax=Rotaria sordida TaxID=392033 RepID=A0A814V5I6_9BILA|nr:unnamed protein product [Rotaria sordida]
MSKRILLSEKSKKCPVICSKSVLNLKSMINQNVTSNNYFEKPKKCKYSLLQQKNYVNGIEKKKRKNLQSYSNRNVLIEYLRKPDMKKISYQRTVISKKHHKHQDLKQSNVKNTIESNQNPSERILIRQNLMDENEQINNDKNMNVQQKAMHSNDEESTIISWLPLSSSISQCDSSTSFCNVKPLLSFPIQSSTHINDEYVTRVRHIIESWNDHENELKSIQNINSTSTNSSNIDDDINDHKPKSSITSSNQTTSNIHNYSNTELSTNHKLIDNEIYPCELKSLINNSPIHQQYPQFKSAHHHVGESQSSIPSELLDCCDSNQRSQSTSIENNSDYWDSFHTSVMLRETMINISKRLIKTKSLPMVDTHCHFDLIFDRLYIKHNNFKRYFDDYKDLYPSGFSFELAIQVFWRPRHLYEKNWINLYSTYLNDERIYGSCGIHPHWSSAWNETSIEDIERCLKHPKVVAIGEIGLDFGPKNTCNMDQQCRVFEEQLKLAVKWLKPIVIHSRDAYQKTFHIMKQYLEPHHKIHLHCFVGTIDDVHLFTSYFTEIKFGFTPIISRGNSLHTVIQQLDLTQILSETDSPYFVPEELSSLLRCAHPSMVYSVVETVAQIRQLSIDDVACQLRENAHHIYGV